MAKDNRFFNTLMARARSRRSPAGHKWYDAAPTYAPKTAPSSESPDANKLAVGGGSAGGLNYATGQMDLASPTSYGAGRGTMVDYYSGREYSGGPYNYRDAPVDFKTGEQLGSPFASVDFVKDETGAIRTMTGAELASMEAGIPSNLSFVSSGEAALSAPIGAVGTSNPVALDLIDMLAGGTGFATGFLGPTVVGARGKETAIGSGLPQFFGKEKVKKDYEVFENIKAGNPGYHQFYMGNQLVSIAPNEGFLKENLGLGNEFVAYGNIDIETAKQIIGGAKGIDPRTIDFSKSMEDEAFGERLVGYIPDVGGLTQNLEFVDSSGKINSSIPNPTAYAGLMATAYGNDRAAADLNLLAQRTGSSKMAELAQQAARGELSARAYRDDNGQVIGFEGPTGGYVTNEQGDPVRTGSGGYAVYGTGPVSAEAVLGDRIGDLSGDSGVGIGDFSVSLGDGYGSMSGSDGTNYSQKAKEATSRGETFFGGSDQNDNEGPSGAGTSRGESASDLSGTGYDGGYSSPFADGGRVGKQEGGEAVAKSGFIEQRTDQVSEAETVADNVPMDVEEGAFIVNGAAIEFMGIADFQKMVQDAVEKARELGIDIPENGGKMGDGEVPLAVSRGEGYISEPLAKIIGYDKLNKINNRGKKEVAQRLQESEQAPEQPQPTDAQGQRMAPGGEVEVFPYDEKALQEQMVIEGEPQQVSVQETPDRSFISAQGKGVTGTRSSEAQIQGEAGKRNPRTGEGFAVRPRVNYNEQKRSQEFPDGVVVDEQGKNIGFALEGQMFLSNDKSLRAGIEQQKSKSNVDVNLPAEYGGETIKFGSGSTMKRYNMGATFGPVDIDVSKTQVPQGDDVMGGSVRYRFSESGDVTLEATDDGRSGRIGLNYRF